MRLAAALCLLLLAATPAQADEFCIRLKAIIRSAPADFEAIRGPASDDGALFKTPLALPGADGPSPCQVEAADPQVGLQTYLYSCRIGGGSWLAPTYIDADKLARRIMTCLGRYATRSDIRNDSSRIQVTDAMIRIQAYPGPQGESPDWVSLDITPLKYVPTRPRQGKP